MASAAGGKQPEDEEPTGPGEGHSNGRRALWEEVLEGMGGEEGLPDPLEEGESLRASIAERLREMKRNRGR
jgi:hypothetical protein